MDAAHAGADALAVELLHGLDGAVLAHPEVRARRVVGLDEPEQAHPLAGDAHRADREIPAVAPVAGGDLRPGRRDEARLDAERRRHLHGGVHVEPGDLPCGQLVRGALRVDPPRGALHRERLRRVCGVGRHDEGAAREHLRELVGRRVSVAGRGLVSTSAAARDGEDAERDSREERDHRSDPG